MTCMMSNGKTIGKKIMSREDKLEIAKMAYKEIMLALKSVSIYKDVDVSFFWFGVLSVDGDFFIESDMKEA